MFTVYASRDIDAPPDKVWSAIDDFGGVHRFHPFVESSPLLTDKRTGTGATRECHMYDGRSIVEKIVDYDPGHGYDVEVVKSSMPLKKAYARLEVTELVNNRARASLRMQFQPKFGPLGWIMGRFMMKPMMTRMLDQVLEGLDGHLKTGKVVGKDGVLRTA